MWRCTQLHGLAFTVMLEIRRQNPYFWVLLSKKMWRYKPIRYLFGLSITVSCASHSKSFTNDWVICKKRKENMKWVMFDIPSDNEPWVTSQRTQQCTVAMKQWTMAPRLVYRTSPDEMDLMHDDVLLISFTTTPRSDVVSARFFHISCWYSFQFLPSEKHLHFECEAWGWIDQQKGLLQLMKQSSLSKLLLWSLLCFIESAPLL